MARRVWIIAKKDKVEDSDIADATLNGCPEIANGIPPALEGIIGALPCVYEEPEPPIPEPPRDLAAELDEIKAKIADYDNVKARVETLEAKKVV